jgi:hypothetical protein
LQEHIIAEKQTNKQAKMIRNNNNNNNNNNSVEFFIIYVPSQQLQGQLQTQHSADIGKYIMDKHNIKSRVNYKNTLMQKNKQMVMGNNNSVQFSSLLFMCRVNSHRANYRHSTVQIIIIIIIFPWVQRHVLCRE